MGQPFRAVVARTMNFESPSIMVQTKNAEEVTVDFTQDEHGAVVVNVRPGKGMANSVDVEYFHSKNRSQTLV